MNELKEVERSPDGRYIRFDEKLGTGAYKAVWLAYDTEAGIEVAWNLVDLRRLPEKEKERLRSETDILRNLNHAHIIVFYQVWENPELEQVIFTTERVTSGSLKQYIQRIKPVKIKVIKKWCRQILLALIYLHSQNPPIIHRDLKCDNIFINGNSGDLRIGDLGLSTMRSQTHAVSVLGTPEFMAPELYDEYYNEKVDVYAFGMCVLEMVTNAYPYEECTNAAQIYKKVASGVMPVVIEKIKHKGIREFITFCLGPQDHRPSALDLLHHPFLSLKNSDYRDGGDSGFEFPKPLQSPSTSKPDLQTTPMQVTSQEVVLESTSENIARIVLRIHVGDKRKEIKFPFDLETDTADAVAAEMVKELKLDDAATDKLADGIYNSIQAQRELWKKSHEKDHSGATETSSKIVPIEGKQDDAEYRNEAEKYRVMAEDMTAIEIKTRIAEIGGEELGKSTYGLGKNELVELFIKQCVQAYAKGEKKPLLKRANSVSNKNREDHGVETALFSKAVVTDAETYREYLESHETEFSLEQLDLIQKLAKKRDSKLQIHKRAYLRAKMITNLDYNTQLFGKLKEWGMDVPEPLADPNLLPADTPRAKPSSKGQRVQSSVKGTTKIVKNDETKEFDDMGDLEVRLTRPFLDSNGNQI